MTRIEGSRPGCRPAIVAAVKGAWDIIRGAPGQDRNHYLSLLAQTNLRIFEASTTIATEKRNVRFVILSLTKDDVS